MFGWDVKSILLQVSLNVVIKEGAYDIGGDTTNQVGFALWEGHEVKVGEHSDNAGNQTNDNFHVCVCIWLFETFVFKYLYHCVSYLIYI